MSSSRIPTIWRSRVTRHRVTPRGASQWATSTQSGLPRAYSSLRRGGNSARSLPKFTIQQSAHVHHARRANSTSSPSDSSPPKQPTPEMYLQALEGTATAPWVALEHTASDRATPEDRLKRAYSRIFQIVMYLARPQEEEAAAQFLDDFEKAALTPGSDIARARSAIAVLVGTVVKDVDSIPLSSPLRVEHRELFDIFGALRPLYDTFALEEQGLEQPTWAEFWSRGQYILITLGEKLDQCGYGYKEESS